MGDGSSTAYSRGQESPAWASRGGAEFAGSDFRPYNPTQGVPALLARPNATVDSTGTALSPKALADNLSAQQAIDGPLPSRAGFGNQAFTSIAGLESPDPSQFSAGKVLDKTSQTIKTPEMTKPVSASQARLTFYGPNEDEYGSTTAQPGRNGKNTAENFFTAAVDPKIIPYGSYFQVPELQGKLDNNPNAIFLAHDTGSAVKSQTASKGQKPVIDLFANQPSSQLNKLNQKMGQNITYRILPQQDALKLYGG